MASRVLVQASSSPPSLSSLSSSEVHHPPFHGIESSCSTMADIKQFHSKIIRHGLSTDNKAMGQVIKFCANSKSGDLNYALKVFDEIPQPDAFIYNALIRGYLQSQLTKDCILLYIRMLQQYVFPNGHTFPSVVRACSVGNAIEEGKLVHAHVFKFGFGDDVFAQNNLIHMYVNFQCLDEAQRVFDQMTRPSVVSWTSLITGYSQCGFVDEAYKVFELMPVRNSVSWNAMIAAYVHSNRFREAFGLFDRMLMEKVELDKFVAASMLSACTAIGDLEQGKSILGYIEKFGIELDSKLATSIIDMYCKCGCLEKALEVFHGLSHKGTSSWNCMIGGIAVHGQGEVAIELFKKMEEDKVAPNDITFVNVLSACARSGLVKEGWEYFHLMKEVYGIEPKREHFGCMVNLLCRAGLLEEARKVIDEMPMSPDAGVYGYFLRACKIHGDIELGEEFGKKHIELEPHNSERYVLLANLYASVGRWDDVAAVRKLMNDRGVKKVPGFPVIKSDGSVGEFIAEGRAHLEAEAKQIDSDRVLHDINEEGKEVPLY